MKSDNPMSVVQALGEIDDQLALNQQRHSELAGLCKAGADALKKRIAFEQSTLMEADGKLAANKAEAIAIGKLYKSDEYIGFKTALQEYETLEQMFDYLDTRRSIGQSILKLYRETEFGQTQGQAGKDG